MNRLVGSLLAVVLVPGVAGFGGSAADTQPVAAELPSSTVDPNAALIAWFRAFNTSSSVGRSQSAEWVRTTRADANKAFSGAGIADNSPVFLVDITGDFAWDHSCPAGSPPSSCRSVGSHAVFTLDVDRLQELDFGIVNAPPALASLGVVGHVDL